MYTAILVSNLHKFDCFMTLDGVDVVIATGPKTQLTANKD
jgi:hypothetical protein